MVADWIYVTGQVLSIAALFCGACLVLMGMEPFSSWFRGKSAASLSLSPKEVRLIESFPRCAFDALPQSGNSLLDMQHHGLIDTTNKLRDAILTRRTGDEVSALIDTLIRDTQQHFQDEEATLTVTGHPISERHCGQHRQLLNDVASRLGQYREGTLGIGELFQYLNCEVLTEHFLGADQEFASYSEVGNLSDTTPRPSRSAEARNVSSKLATTRVTDDAQAGCGEILTQISFWARKYSRSSRTLGQTFKKRIIFAWAVFHS